MSAIKTVIKCVRDCGKTRYLFDNMATQNQNPRRIPLAYFEFKTKLLSTLSASRHVLGEAILEYKFMS